MKNKIVGILVMALFFISSLSSISYGTTESKSQDDTINAGNIFWYDALGNRGNEFPVRAIDTINNTGLDKITRYNLKSEGNWRWVHNGASHDKDECFFSINLSSAGTAGFACVLDLSADIGNVISKLSFCEYACSGTAGLNGRAIVYVGDYSAPSGSPLANIPFIVNQIREYRDLDIPDVTIVSPGTYWIVIEIDQTGIEQCVVGLDDGPMVYGGGYLEANHGGWTTIASNGFDYNPLIEAYVESSGNPDGAE